MGFATRSASFDFLLNESPRPVFLPIAMPPAAVSTAVANSTHASDESLMLAARDGDVGAFTVLARRYSARLIAYCRRLTHSPAAAEEAAQETWLGLWSARRSYEPSSRFVVLLFVAARNRCKNVHRGQMRARNALGQPAAVDELTSASPSALEQVLTIERRRRLSTRIDQLSEALREALVLRVVDELSYADVGAIMEIPEATARTRVHLAMQKLRELERKEES